MKKFLFLVLLLVLLPGLLLAEDRTYKIAWDPIVDPEVVKVKVYLVEISTPDVATFISEFPDNATSVELNVSVPSTKSYYLEATAVDRWGNESVKSTPATKDGKVHVIRVVTTLSTLKILDLLKIWTSGFVATPK